MKTFKTQYTKSKDIYYFFLDFSIDTLGRCSSDASRLLNAKFIHDFSPNKYYKINLYIINSKDIKLSGNKSKDKSWYYYKGSNLQEKKMSEKNIEFIVKHSISGMLNKNKLRKLKEKRIKIISDHMLDNEIKKINSKYLEDIKSITNNFLFNKNILLHAYKLRNDLF